jgi:ribosomal protein S18 acetylase RimI-like enzyme
MDGEFEVGMRYSCLNDMPTIVEIENEVAMFPWNTGDLMEFKAPGTCGQVRVAIYDNKVIGYTVFSLEEPATIEIIKLVVAKDYRRRGVGTKMLKDIMGKMWENDELVFFVRESNLPAQLFLQKHGLKATIEKMFFQNQRATEYDGEEMPWHYEDAYRFAAFAPFT